MKPLFLSLHEASTAQRVDVFQVRRDLRNQPLGIGPSHWYYHEAGDWWTCGDNTGTVFKCPHKPGQVLACKESYTLENDAGLGFPPPHKDGRPIQTFDETDGWIQPHYRANGDDPQLTCGHEGCEGGPCERPWLTPQTMPLWAVRTHAEVASITVKRTQDVTEEDARGMGAKPHEFSKGDANSDSVFIYRDDYITMMKRDYPSAWEKNACQWVYTLKKAFNHLTHPSFRCILHLE